MWRSSPAGTMQAAEPVEMSARSSSTWVPRLGAICGTSSSSISSEPTRSAQTPVALTTFSASTSKRAPDSASTAATPTARPSRVSTSLTSAPFRVTAPKRSASPRIVSTSRTSSVWQS